LASSFGIGSGTGRESGIVGPDDNEGSEENDGAGDTSGFTKGASLCALTDCRKLLDLEAVLGDEDSVDADPVADCSASPGGGRTG
jgi:hypothetical protein